MSMVNSIRENFGWYGAATIAALAGGYGCYKYAQDMYIPPEVRATAPPEAKVTAVKCMEVAAGVLTGIIILEWLIIIGAKAD